MCACVIVPKLNLNLGDRTHYLLKTLIYLKMLSTVEQHKHKSHLNSVVLHEIHIKINSNELYTYYSTNIQGNVEA